MRGSPGKAETSFPDLGEEKDETGPRTFEMDLGEDLEFDFPGVGDDVMCRVGGARVGLGA